MPDNTSSVLVVDDDVDTCQNLADILSDLGYETTVAHDGPSALAQVQSRPFDVALLDFKMPGMNGLEVYRAIKAIRPETVAVVVSAFTDPATRQAAMEAGALEVLAKPVDFTVLLHLVASAVGQPLVLVVDDDPDLCTSLWDLLREEGYRVCLANSGETAIERLHSRQFKVVLIDMKLPDRDGSAVARAVRAENPDARTVIITGFRQEFDEQVRKAVEEGADAVCYKPFDMPRLLEKLQELTGKNPRES